MWYENVKMGRTLYEINENIRQRAERSASYDDIERTVYESLQPFLENVMQRKALQSAWPTLKPVANILWQERF
jgi:hypothetical protein